MVTWMNRNHSHRVNIHYRAGILSTLVFSACALLLPGRCFADDVSVAVANPSQTATPGQTVVFMGTVTNDIIEDFSATDFNFMFSGYSSDLTVTQLLGMPNFSIGAGATTPIVDLFSVTLDSTIAPGSYPVDFILFANTTHPYFAGGGSVTITVTPEPSTMWLMATGLIIFATTLRRSIRKRSKQAA